MSAAFDLATVQEATREGRLLVAHCPRCGSEQALPGPACFRCGSGELSVRTHPGDGSIYSWSVTGIAFEPELADEVPYVVAVVLLSGGAKVWARLAGVDPNAPIEPAELPVQLDAEQTRQRGFVVFRPRESAGSSQASPAQ